MQTNQDRLYYLAQQYINRLCTEEEFTELFRAIEDEKNIAVLQNFMDEKYFSQLLHVKANEVNWDHVYAQVMAKAGANKRSHFKWWRMAAAAIVFFIAGGTYLYMTHKSKATNITSQAKDQLKNDFLPGGDKAILTLANGNTIILDSAKNGLVSEQGKTSILKTGSGQLAYNTTEAKDDEILFNTIATPKGGQYMVVLSDGTKVWLNAASSLRYPTAFTGKERSVLLTGEAYFEVVHNAKQPFIVHADNIEVHDLGTEFNINAYADEPSMNITLVKGLAAVKNNNESVTLQPGKAATVTGKHTEVVNADITTATAWKNGVFEFNESTIESVMRQVARWYNVDVEYKGKITERFNGSIYRSSKASKVFEILEATGHVKLDIDNGKIVVAPVQ